jgi:hypothetical protein
MRRIWGLGADFPGSLSFMRLPGYGRRGFLSVVLGNFMV